MPTLTEEPRTQGSRGLRREVPGPHCPKLSNFWDTEGLGDQTRPHYRKESMDPGGRWLCFIARGDHCDFGQTTKSAGLSLHVWK